MPGKDVTERELLEIMTDEQRADYEARMKKMSENLFQPIKRNTKTDLFGTEVPQKTAEEKQYHLATCLERFYQLYFTSGFSTEVGIMTTEAEEACADLAHAYDDWLD